MNSLTYIHIALGQLLLCLVLFIGCGPREISLSELQKQGSLHYKAGETEPFTGRAAAAYPDGKVKEQRYYKEGLPHGPALFYHPDGTVKWEMKFKKGKQHGKTVYYHPNGKINALFHYKGGQRHGDYERFKPSGVLLEKGRYEEGKQVLSQTYNEDGTLQNEKTF